MVCPPRHMFSSASNAPNADSLSFIVSQMGGDGIVSDATSERWAAFGADSLKDEADQQHRTDDNGDGGDDDSKRRSMAAVDVQVFEQRLYPDANMPRQQGEHDGREHRAAGRGVHLACSSCVDNRDVHGCSNCQETAGDPFEQQVPFLLPAGRSHGVGELLVAGDDG